MGKNNYIQILEQDLKKKNQILDAVIQVNQVQKDALEDPNLDPDDFDEIVEEKGKLIDSLEHLDEGFEQIYARVREELMDNKEAYRDEIRRMQELIRQITDKTATVQADEQRNKVLMSQKFVAVKQQLREIRSSQKVVNEYYQNMMKSKFMAPQFLDNKK